MGISTLIPLGDSEMAGGEGASTWRSLRGTLYNLISSTAGGALVPVLPAGYGLSDPAFSRVYGPGAFILDGLWEINADGATVPMISFQATASGTMNAISLYWSHGPGYAAGDGGDIRIRLWPDNGSNLPNRAGQPLTEKTYAPRTRGMSGGSYPSASDQLYKLTVPNATLVKGSIYHLEFYNTNGSPGANWSSIDYGTSLSSVQSRANRYLNPYVWGGYYYDRTLTTVTDWRVNPHGGTYIAPVMQIWMADGSSFGNANVESGNVDDPTSRRVFALTANQPFKEIFTPTSSRNVSGFSLMASKASGTGGLTWYLEDGGVLIESGTIADPGNDYTTINATGDYFQGQFAWRDVLFAQTHALQSGRTYQLRFVPVGDSLWRACTTQNGAAYAAFATPAAFTESRSQISNDSGSTWHNTYHWGNQSAVGSGYENWRVFFHVASAATHVDFLGRQHLTPYVGGDPDHEGYPGAQFGPAAQAVVTPNPGIQPANNNYDRLPDIQAAFPSPDYILIEHGWNDAEWNPNNAYSLAIQFYDRVHALFPYARIGLLTLNPYQGYDEAGTGSGMPGYAAVNSAIRAYASAHPSYVDLYDIAAQVTFTAADWIDTIHMTQSGADKKANYVFNRMQTLGLLSSGAATQPSNGANRVLRAFPASFAKGLATTAAGATAGAVRLALANYASTQIGAGYRISVYKANQSAPVPKNKYQPAVKIGMGAGSIPVANNRLEIPSSAVTDLLTSTGAGLTTPTRVLRVENAAGTLGFEGWLGQSAGDDFNVTGTVAAGQGIALASSGIVIQWDASLDGVVAPPPTGSGGTITTSDYRHDWGVDPSQTCANQTQPRNKSLIQAVVFPNQPITTYGTNGATYGANTIVKTGVADPDNAGRYCVYHRIASDQPVWQGVNYNSSIGNTWRAEIISTEQSTDPGLILYGQPYWYVYPVRFDADCIGTLGNSIMDAHTQVGVDVNGNSTRGPSPISYIIYNNGGTLTLQCWRAWSTGGGYNSQTGAQTPFGDTALSTTTWYYIIGRCLLHWDTSRYNTYHQVWIASGNAGAAVQIADWQNVPIGFNDGTAYLFCKSGLYRFDPWGGDSSQTRTMRSKGFHLFRDVIDSNSLTLQNLLTWARTL